MDGIIDSMDTLEATPLRLVAGRFDLWNRPIPGSGYLDNAGALREWRIVEVTSAHVGENVGVIVAVEGPEGQVAEDFAPEGRWCALMATIGALRQARALAETEETPPPTWDFDGLFDLCSLDDYGRG